MRKYLLLRDNKQTGPMGYDEIMAIGFRKYDLVWVEGRSAAWRYPGELDEFKEHAPLVEEQPFDRFMKKKSEKVSENIGQPVENAVQKAVDMPVPEAKPSLKPFGTEEKAAREEKSNTSEPPRPVRKYVAVSLPAGRKAAPSAEKPAPVQTPKNYNPEKSKPVAVPTSHLAYAGGQKTDELLTAPAPTPSTTNSNLQREQVVILHQPPASRFELNKYLQYVAVAAGLASLLLIGILLGRSSEEPVRVAPIVSPEPSRITELKEKLKLSTPASTPSEEMSVMPVVNATSATGSGEPARPRRDGRAALSPSPQQYTDDPSIALPKEENVVTPLKKLESEKPSQKEDLVNRVDVKLNAYKVKPFGGIENIEVTVENHSAQSLREVVVELRYVLSNGKHLTENMRFSDVDAGGRVTLAAPKSNRGIRLESRVVSAR